MPKERNSLPALAMVEGLNAEKEEGSSLAGAFTLIMSKKGECNVLKETICDDVAYPVDYDLLLTVCIRVLEDLRFARQFSALSQLRKEDND